MSVQWGALTCWGERQQPVDKTTDCCHGFMLHGWPRIAGGLLVCRRWCSSQERVKGGTLLVAAAPEVLGMMMPVCVATATVREGV